MLAGGSSELPTDHVGGIVCPSMHLFHTCKMGQKGEADDPFSLED